MWCLWRPRQEGQAERELQILTEVLSTHELYLAHMAVYKQRC